MEGSAIEHDLAHILDFDHSHHADQASSAGTTVASERRCRGVSLRATKAKVSWEKHRAMLSAESKRQTMSTEPANPDGIFRDPPSSLRPPPPDRRNDTR